MIHEFTLDTVHLLDGGKIAEAWKQAVQRALADCMDRPNMAKPRTVTMTLALTPEAPDGLCDSVNAQFAFKDGLPSRQSRPYNLGVRQRAKQLTLVFNDLSQDDVRQHTIDETTGDEAK